MKQSDNTSASKKWRRILAWVFLFPFMVMFSIGKSKRFNKPTKAILIVLVFVATYFFLMFTDPHQNSNTTSEKQEDSAVTQESEEELFVDVLTDSALRHDFINACEDVGISPNKVRRLIQVEDWTNGPRFSFSYSGLTLIAYCNSDSTINSINLADVKLYQRGYEPYPITDYIVDNNWTMQLQLATEDYVKSQLNFPETADFHSFDWNYSRNKNIYYISGTVTAQNAFGVKEKMPFTLAYDVTDDSATLVYFDFSGSIIMDKLESESLPRKKRPIQESTTSTTAESITITYGELGQYGKSVELDGIESINYHIPPGSYTMTSSGNSCTVFLAGNEYTTNIDGYQENEIIETFELSKEQQSRKITISNGQHLELSINASVTLTPSHNQN